MIHGCKYSIGSWNSLIQRTRNAIIIDFYIEAHIRVDLSVIDIDISQILSALHISRLHVD